MKIRIPFNPLSAVFLLMASMYITACQKEVESEIPDPTPVPSPKAVHVAFATGSIGLDKADSVLIKLTNADKTKTINGKAVKKTADYLIALDTLPAGSWQMDLEVYSKPTNGGFKYTLNKAVTLPLAEELIINGPTALLADQWKTLLFIKETGFSITVPLDPTNPAFEVRSFQGPWDYVNVERHLDNGTTEVAAEGFQSGAEGFPADNIIRDNTTFIDFSNKAKTLTWTSGEIYVILVNIATNDDKTIYWKYDRK